MGDEAALAGRSSWPAAEISTLVNPHLPPHPASFPMQGPEFNLIVVILPEVLRLHDLYHRFQISQSSFTSATLMLPSVQVPT